MPFHLHTTKEQEDYLLGLPLSARARFFLARYL